MSEFDFEIQYIPGETNGFADALSRIYSDENEGVVQADSEFIEETDNVRIRSPPKAHPVYVEAYLLDLMNAEVTRRSGSPTSLHLNTKRHEIRN